MPDTFEFIVNQSRDFITLIDRHYRYVFVNEAYARTVGLPRKEIVDRTVPEIWGEDRFEETIKAQIDRCLSGEEVHYVENFRFGTQKKSMHVSFYPYGEEAGEVTHVLVFSHDITRLAEVENRLQDFEYRDALTGLYNRRSLEELLATELQRARRSTSDRLRGVVFLSLKNFKEINRAYGHHIGDLLLEHSANRLRDVVRSSDLLFRFDGANLVVLLTQISRETDVAMVAQKLFDAVAVPYDFRGEVIHVYAYLGVSIYPQDGEDVTTLIQRANSASVEAEVQGKPFVIYNAELHSSAVRRMTMVSELQRAFEEGQLELYFQPIMRVRPQGAQMVGAEALIRWNHPSQGRLNPAAFIELAEQSGLVALIDKWALYRIIHYLREWGTQPPFFISMNISAEEMADEFLLEVVQAALKEEEGVDPSMLKLELTESMSMRNPDTAIRQMELLQEAGIDVWIDDFGTGHSSLGYLKQLPSKVLKLDRFFVADIEHNSGEREYLESVLRTVTSRGKEAIMEGVTTAEQVNLLLEMGCSLMQGYYFSLPMPARELRELLEDGGTGG
ncbi:MAG: putative bifunctional diguanylate cyclase/phosphodiesterase [Spirochaetaceae bacterium]